MTAVSQTSDSSESSDGRVVRRKRNIDAALDVVIELFTEGELFPSVERVAERSGLSVRSIYRYFDTPAELHDAAVRRHREQAEPLAHLPAIGQGPLADRIDAFVTMRLRLHRSIGATYRATVHNAPNHPGLQRNLRQARNDLRAQLEQQFEPELNAVPPQEREAVTTAADVFTQLDSIDQLRTDRRLTVAQTTAVLRTGLHRLLIEGTTP